MRLRFLFLVLVMSAPVRAETVQPYKVDGDAIAHSLTGKPGDAARGQALIADRQKGLCLLCHTGPFSETHMQGNLAPDLRAAAGTLTPGQLRLRVVDMRQINPDTIMPAFYRNQGFTRVLSPWQDKPILTAEQIEDVVAYLITLQDK